MSDLCFEDDAEARCEAETQAALQQCPTSIHALQTLASFRLCQQRRKEARAAMKRAVQALSVCDDEQMPAVRCARRR